MNIEYEVRVLEIDKDKIIKKIEEQGGSFVGKHEQKRYVYDFNPKVEGKWIRLRTNGNKTTLTIKEITASTIDGTKELEIDVSSFDDTHEMLKELGYLPKAYQENRRTRYMLNGVEVDIDEWPMIPTYLEIEGKNEQEVNSIIEVLNIEQSKITSAGVQSIYNDIYGIDIDSIETLKF